MERTQKGASAENARDILIPIGAGMLRGALRVPAAAGGVVLLVQTSAEVQTLLDEQALAQQLGSAGLGILQLALLTPRESVIDQQTRHLRFDLPLLARRLVTVAGWFALQPDLASLRLGFCGASTGAGVALLAAASLGSRLGAVVSCDGRPDLAGAALAQVTAPTLLLVGKSAEEMAELNRAALAQLPGVKALEFIRGAPHFFDTPDPWTDIAVAVTMKAAAWFQHHLTDSVSNLFPPFH